MGGGSSAWLDYDSTRRKRTRSSGKFGDISVDTDMEIGQTVHVDPDLLPLKDDGTCRRIDSWHKHPIGCVFDVTGSMHESLPVVMDRLGSIFIELERKNYLSDPCISFAAVGDAYCDSAPIQVAQFSQSEELTEYLKKMWPESGGGGQSRESYELMAYYYARKCDLKNEEIPFFFIIGDEDYYKEIDADQVKKHFGDDIETLDSRQIFEELKVKFHGNVFHIHVPYSSSEDAKILKSWRSVLGENAIDVKDPSTINEVMLGIIAMTTKSRSLDAFIEDSTDYMAAIYNTEKDDETIIEKAESIKKILLPYSKTVTDIVKKTTTTEFPEPGSKTIKRTGEEE